jgi:neutral amino acid transport system permease protein
LLISFQKMGELICQVCKVMVNYLVFLVISAATFALFSLGLNLQWGYTGLINFGHVAFMTIGAYATVLLTAAGIPLIFAVLIGAVLSAGLGLLIGISTLRLREDYLAIVTIGVSEVVRLVALNEEWLTRGSFGVQNYPLPLADFRPNLLGKGILIALLTLVVIFAFWRLGRVVKRHWQTLQSQQEKQNYQHIGLIVLAAAIAICGVVLYRAGVIALYNYSSRAGLMLVSVMTLAVVYWLLEIAVRSPWGRILKAIREDEQVPKALGKNVFWYKLQALMLGGAIAGIAGAFYAWQLTTVYPTNFEPLITFYAWTIVVLGGAGSNAGAILGAIIFWAYSEGTRFFLPQLAFIEADRLGAFRIMIIGLILMLLMLWRPQGILGKKEELTLGR